MRSEWVAAFKQLISNLQGCLPTHSAHQPAEARERRTDDHADAALGEALIDATLFWREWCFRRVDSIQPLHGERGRRRHSIDCRPPDDPGLAYVPAERFQTSMELVRGKVILPLAYVEKGPLRHFDAVDSAGESMPILGASETAELAALMVERLLTADSIATGVDARDALTNLAGPSTSEADSEEVEKLIVSGSWRGRTVWARDEDVSPTTASLIRALSRTFLLLGLLDAHRTGVRQVIKFSYHFSVSSMSPRDRLLSPLIGLGIASRQIDIPLDVAHTAQSYHLEFHVPPELRCVELAMPLPVGCRSQPGLVDAQSAPVAHAYASYAQQPAEPARVKLDVPLKGLRWAAFLATAFTAIVVGLVLFLPFAKDVWSDSADSVAAILIAAPAVYFGLLASRGENALATQALAFLRALLFISALSLFTVATSLVGQLNQPMLDLLWLLIIGWNALAAGVLIFGRSVSEASLKLWRYTMRER